MVEFFQNIWTWLINNTEQITVLFSSASFASFVSAAILFVKQLRATKSNSQLVDALKIPLNKLIELADTLSSVFTHVDAIETKVETLDVKIANLEKRQTEEFDMIEQKLDAILNVQSIVYSSMKDETARKNIFDILTTAKLASSSTKAAMQKEIDELKAFKAEIVNKVTVSQSVQEVPKVPKEQNVKRQSTKTTQTLRY